MVVSMLGELHQEGNHRFPPGHKVAKGLHSLGVRLGQTTTAFADTVSSHLMSSVGDYK